MEYLAGHVLRDGDVECEVAAHVVHAVVVVERVRGAVAGVNVDVWVLPQVNSLHVAETWANNQTDGQMWQTTGVVCGVNFTTKYI